MTPLVSVVVPTHNRSRLLRRTLRSILGQQVALEVVVVDDGSTDDTVTVAAIDPRVLVVRHSQAAGVSAARNRGISEARGKWIAFCDDDDLWAPDKLTRQLEAVEREGADWVYAGDVNVDDRLRVLSGGPPPDPALVMSLMERGNPIASGGSNVVVRARVLSALGGFDRGLRRTEDWDLWIRLARVGTPAWVCEPLVAYRFHAGNVTAAPDEMLSEALQLSERYGLAVDVAAMQRRAAWAALRAGRRGLALRYYARAVAGGDWRSIGRAAIAATHPAVGTDRIFALLDRDAGWIARAEQWLTDVRGDSAIEPDQSPASRG